MRDFAERVLVAALIIGALIAVAYAMGLVLLVFAGILLAIFLRTAGDWVSRMTRLPHLWAMAAVVLVFLVVLFGTAWEFGATFAAQADELFLSVSRALTQFQEQARNYKGLQPMLARSLNVDLQTPAQTAASLGFWISSVLILVLFVGVYVSVRPDLYINLFLSLFNRTVRGRVKQVLDEIGHALQWWLFGQLISMGVVGAITATGLIILGIPMALPLAVLAMFLTFVPYIGAIVSAIPAILIALTFGAETALYTALVYLIAHIAEGYLVVPMVQQRFVNLPPALILATQFVSEHFFGLVGVALATPALVVAMVLMNRFYYHQDWEAPRAA